MDVFDLSASLTLDTTQYDKGLSGAESRAGTFGTKLKGALKGGAIAFAAVTAAATALSGAFVKGVKDTAAYGDNVDKMSQKLGLSAEGFQKWDYVMKIAGTDINSMSTGLKTLTNKIDDAKNGGSDAQEMFSKLGISMDELNKMSREEAFEATIKGFQGMADSTERAALANDLFGKSGQNLTPLFNQTAEDTEKQLKLAEDYGMVMPEAAVKASAAFEDSMTTMQMTMQGMRNRMMGEFLPAITKVTDGLATLFTGDMGGLDDIEKGMDEFVGKIANVLPKIIEIGGKIISSLVMSIGEHMPELIEQVIQVVTEFITTLIDNLPRMLEIGAQMIQALVQGLVEAIPQIVTALAENAGAIVEGGVNIILALVDGLIQAIPTLIEALPQIIEAFIMGLIEHLPQIIEAGINLIIALAGGLIKAIPQLIAMIPKIISALFKAIITVGSKLISAGVSLVKNIITGIGQMITNAVTKAKELISRVWEAVKNAVVRFVDGGVALVKNIISGIGQKIKDAVDKGKELLSKIWNGIKKGVEKFLSIGTNIVKGIWQGISDGFDWIIDKIKGWVDSLLDWIKDFLGIDSPSKVFRDEVGRYIAEGVALGILDGQQDVQDALESIIPEGDANYELETSVVGGELQNALEVSIGGVIESALSGLTPVLQQGMADALDGVQVRLNSRNFGKLTREAVNGTI